MTRDEAFTAVVKAMTELDIASKAAEEAWSEANRLRQEAHKAGDRLNAARDVLDNLLRREASVEPYSDVEEKTA